MPSRHLIYCRPLLLLPPIPPSIRVFSSESTLRMRWPKFWSFSFSISPSNEHSGLISFRMDWLDHLALQGTLESSPTPQFKSINSSVFSFLHSPALTSIHDHWKNHSLDYDQCKEIEENNSVGKTRDLSKKIRDTKGTFHAKMGSIKDRNGMDLTEAEDIKKRW